MISQRWVRRLWTAGAAAVLFGSSAKATDYTWQGGGTNIIGLYLWTAANNWLAPNGAPPATPPGSGSRVIYNSTSANEGSTYLNSPFTVNQVRVTNTDANVLISSIAGNSLTINPRAAGDYGNIGIDMSSASNGTNNLTINPNGGVGIGAGTQFWNIATGRQLTIGSNLSGSGNVTVNGNGTSRVILSGGDNSAYSGAFVLNTGGTLQVNNANSLGTGSSTTVNTGATLEISQNAAYTVAETINLYGGTLLNTGTAAHTLTGGIDLSGTTATITNTGTGAFNLNTAAMTGTATGLTFNGTGTINVTKQLNIGATNVFKDGTNTVNLNADNSGFAGTLTVQAGTLTTNNTNGLGSGSLIVIANGAQITRTGASFTLAGGRELRGDGTFSANAGASAFTVASGATIRPTGADLDITASATNIQGTHRATLTSATTASRLDSTGGINYSGGSVIIDGNGGYTVGSFSVIIAQSAGSFSNIPVSATMTNFGALTAAFTNFTTVNLGGGITGLQANFNVTPEPGTVFAVSAAGLGLAGWVRRRRQAAVAAPEVVA